jgi:hypothetical protein
MSRRHGSAVTRVRRARFVGRPCTAIGWSTPARRRRGRSGGGMARSEAGRSDRGRKIFKLAVGFGSAGTLRNFRIAPRERFE